VVLQVQTVQTVTLETVEQVLYQEQAVLLVLQELMVQQELLEIAV